MRMSKKILKLLFMAAVLMLYACAGVTEESDAAPEYVFTYADNQNEDYPTVQAARFFASQVSEKSEGRIEIKVYANGELGDEQSTIEQIRYGGIDFARVSLSSLTGYSGMAGILLLPYLYKDLEHMWNVLDGEIGEEVMDSFDGSGFEPLSWYDAGVRSFYFTKPVYSLADMQGMNIRVQDVDLMKEMVELLGANPVPAVYSDVYAALEVGTVDGAENNLPSYTAMEHYRVAPYIFLDEHMRVPEMQIISSRTFEKLSEEDQALIKECAEESAQYERTLWKRFWSEAETKALAEGAYEIYPNEEAMQEFRDAVSPLYEEYASDYEVLLERIENAYTGKENK